GCGTASGGRSADRPWPRPGRPPRASSHPLREGVAQAVEEEGPYGEDGQGEKRGQGELGAVGEGPFEEDLLVGHEDVRHGVETQHVPERAGHVAVEVEDGGAEEPQVQDVAQDVLEVPEMDGEGGEAEGEAQGEEEL